MAGEQAVEVPQISLDQILALEIATKVIASIKAEAQEVYNREIPPLLERRATSETRLMGSKGSWRKKEHYFLGNDFFDGGTGDHRKLADKVVADIKERYTERLSDSWALDTDLTELEHLGSAVASSARQLFHYFRDLVSELRLQIPSFIQVDDLEEYDAIADYLWSPHRSRRTASRRITAHTESLRHKAAEAEEKYIAKPWEIWNEGVINDSVTVIYSTICNYNAKIAYILSKLPTQDGIEADENEALEQSVNQFNALLGELRQPYEPGIIGTSHSLYKVALGLLAEAPTSLTRKTTSKLHPRVDGLRNALDFSTLRWNLSKIEEHLGQLGFEFDKKRRGYGNSSDVVCAYKPVES